MRFLAHIFILTCFFPFIDLIRIGTDTQPNAMIIGSLVIFASKKPKLNAPIILLWVTFIISVLFVFTTKLDAFLTAKLVLNYLSPPVVAMAAYIIFTELKYKVKFSVFMAVSMAYLLVGVIQTHFIHDFMSMFLNEARGILVGGRGVISLTTEPAFYGSTCLFLIVFSILNYSKKQNLIAIPLLLFQMVIIAKSSIAFAILAGSIMVFGLVMIIRLKWKYVSALALSLFCVIIFQSQILSYFEGTRTGRIIQNFAKDPLLIAEVDGSIAMRASNTFAPYFVIRHNYFMPMGYGRFLSLLTELSEEGRYRKLITKGTLDQRKRIVGGINMVLFQLGFLGLLLPLAIYLAFKRLLHREAVLFALILFITILFTQIQLMYSLIGLIIASAIYQSNLYTESKRKILAV